MLDIQGLHIRAALFRAIREFFWDQGFLEVDTPVRQPVILPEANILPLTAEGQFLQTSPELCMKRLLAQGCQKIFQLSPCFRKDERGCLHLEEFTMLEWYRRGADYSALITDCGRMLHSLVTVLRDQLEGYAGNNQTVASLHTLFTAPPEILTVEQAFARFSPYSLAEVLEENSFDEVLVEFVEPQLGVRAPTYLTEYPRVFGSLAKASSTNPAVVERFELYIKGVELANGFTELTDSSEQRHRFAKESALIMQEQGRSNSMPERFLADLDNIDNAAGIALGVDRLCMLLLGKDCVTDIVSFGPDDYL